MIEDAVTFRVTILFCLFDPRRFIILLIVLDDFNSYFFLTKFLLIFKFCLDDTILNLMLPSPLDTQAILLGYLITRHPIPLESWPQLLIWLLLCLWYHIMHRKVTVIRKDKKRRKILNPYSTDIYVVVLSKIQVKLYRLCCSF